METLKKSSSVDHTLKDVGGLGWDYTDNRPPFVLNAYNSPVNWNGSDTMLELRFAIGIWAIRGVERTTSFVKSDWQKPLYHCTTNAWFSSPLNVNVWRTKLLGNRKGVSLFRSRLSISRRKTLGVVEESANRQTLFVLIDFDMT